MRKTTLLATVAVISVMSLPLVAQAQLSVPTGTPAVGSDANAQVNGTTTVPSGDVQKGKNLTPEQRQAKRAEMKQKFQSMTPEQKEQFLKEHPKLAERVKQRQERAEKWKQMTPEQREAKKVEMKKKWDAMTPEQQAAFKAKHPNFGKHQDGGKAATPAVGDASAK